MTIKSTKGYHVSLFWTGRDFVYREYEASCEGLIRSLIGRVDGALDIHLDPRTILFLLQRTEIK